jgi:membrane protease YdiL (CAAX protease family)
LVLVATLFVILAVSKGKLKEFGLVGFRFSSFLRPMLLISIFAISTNLLNKYILKFHGVVPEPNDMLNFLFIALIIAPISEELQFRSLLQSTLQKANWKSFRIKNIQITFPVLCSSLVFGQIHITNIFKGASMNFAICNAFSAFITGLIFSYYREKTGSVLISILLHISGNTIALISTSLF